MTNVQAAYDTDLASQKLMDLGGEILKDPGLSGDWDAISLVIELDGNESAYGYSYSGARSAPIAPEHFTVFDAAQALKAAMTTQEGGWRACLIQIRKPELKLHVDFEYDDSARWKVQPDNREARIEELRPR